MLLVGLASVHFAFLYFPADLSIFLSHTFFKGGRAFLVQAFAGESGLGLASNEKLDMCLDRKKKRSLILIQWSTINLTISYIQDVLLQIISRWKFDISLPSTEQQMM